MFVVVFIMLLQRLPYLFYPNLFSDSRFLVKIDLKYAGVF